MKDDEIKEILDYFKDDIEFLEKELKNPNFVGRFITIKDKEYNYLKILLNYITNLQEKINQYENPDDLTLFYMWLDEKAKDKMKQMQERIAYLERSNNRREDTIMGLRDEIVEYEDYKSRCEKAVEYLKQTSGNYRDLHYEPIKVITLINILNGKE